jgi:hypothetical protein
MNFEGTGVTVKVSGNEDAFPVLYTTEKLIFFEDQSGRKRRVTPAKAILIAGDKEPVSKAPKAEAKEVEEMVLGLMTNTNYSDRNVYVEHADKGEFRVIRTSEKLVFAEDESGKTIRITLGKVKSVKIDGEEKEKAEEREIEVDPQMGNDFSQPFSDEEVCMAFSF